MTSREEMNLQKVIGQYFEENEEKKRLEKIVKDKNAFIKSKLHEMGKDLYETDKYKTTITKSSRISMNEELAIQILKDNVAKKDLKNVIKTKEYLDYENLESLIYNGLISAEKLSPANEEKIIESLTVKLRKKEKEDE